MAMRSVTTLKSFVDKMWSCASPEIKSWRRHILMHRIWSLSFTIGKTIIFNPVVWVGVWFEVLMILAYFLDHYVTFQGISLDFLYLVRGRRR